MIVRTARAILSLLAPLTGTRATAGTVRLVATGDPVTLKRRCPLHFVPVLGGTIRPGFVFETELPEGTASVTIAGGAGTDVPIRAALGGTWGNTLEAGTPLVLLPPQDGLQPRATCIVPPSGGAGPDETAWGAILDARILQELRPGRSPEDLTRGAVLRYPAVTLVWAGRWPYTGEAARKSNARLVLERWTLCVLTDQKTTQDHRRLEGLDLVDLVCEQVEGATSTDLGERLTAYSDGITVESARPFLVGPGVYGHALTLRMVALVAIDGLRRRGPPSPWLETSLVMPTTDPATEHDDDPKDVVDIAWDQP